MLLIVFFIVMLQGFHCKCECLVIAETQVIVDCFFLPVNLSEIPQSVETIQLRNLSVDAVQLFNWTELLLFPNLTELRFLASNWSGSDNNTNHIIITLLTNLEQQIQVLQLIDDGLEDLPQTFNNSLHKLIVVGNCIRSLGEYTFRGWHSLKVLNLSGNMIETIQENSFIGAGNLQHLDLANNRLRHISRATLHPLAELQYLNLSNNRLEVVDAECFRGLQRLQQLDISQNRLTMRMAPGSLQLPSSLTQLVLADNPLFFDDESTVLLLLLVGPGKRLRELDASRSGLKQVPAALTHSIRTLHLAGNAITTINCGHFDSYPLLQRLDLSANALKEVEEDALGRLELLAILYMAHNQLHSIPSNLPERLELVHLEHNRIERIASGDLFQNGPNHHLQVLVLSDNRITEIEQGAFRQLRALTTLDLSRNPILTFSIAILSGPSQLQVLRMSDIKAVPFDRQQSSFPLPNPERLIVLDLSKSPGLARQFLDDSATLAAARQLQQLNLADTDIDSIRSDLLHYLTQLTTLAIEGNPFNCSQLQWLSKWLRLQDPHNRAVCSSPQQLFGTLLTDLQSQVDDKPPMPLVQRVVKKDLNRVNKAIIIPNSNRSSSWILAEEYKGDLVNDPGPRRVPLLLAIIVSGSGVVCVLLLLILLSIKVIVGRRHRNLQRMRHEENIEIISSLPSVTELW